MTKSKATNPEEPCSSATSASAANAARSFAANKNVSASSSGGGHEFELARRGRLAQCGERLADQVAHCLRSAAIASKPPARVGAGRCRRCGPASSESRIRCPDGPSRTAVRAVPPPWASPTGARPLPARRLRASRAPAQPASGHARGPAHRGAGAAARCSGLSPLPRRTLPDADLASNTRF